MVKPNGPLNTKFRELLLLVFNFQITLFNDIFVNIWKSVRPTILQYPTSFLSLSRLFFFLFPFPSLAHCFWIFFILFLSSFASSFILFYFPLFWTLLLSLLLLFFLFPGFGWLVMQFGFFHCILMLFSLGPLLTSFLIVIFSFASFLSGE